MRFDQKFFDTEIRQVEKAIQAAHEQAIFSKGALSVLQQLRELAGDGTEDQAPASNEAGNAVIQ